MTVWKVLDMTWGSALLQVHRSYQKPVQLVRFHPALTGISHITGGGIEGNTNRLLREGLRLEIDWQSWRQPVLFRLIQEFGGIADAEMRRVFNLGIGLVMIVRAQGATEVVNLLETSGETVIRMGHIL